MIKKLFFLVALFLSANIFAQNIEEVKNYTWQEKPVFKEIPAEFSQYPAVVLKDYRLYENKIGEYTFKAFVVKHFAIKILSGEKIGDYNTVSINKRYVRDYRDLKARVIKPDGKVIELPKEKIIEKENSDSRQFAFEGVEEGDIIEYFYVIKDFPVFSDAEYFQRDIPVLDAKFQINEVRTANTNVQPYNGLELIREKDKIIVKGTNIPAAKDERNATVIANLAKVFFYVGTYKSFSLTSYYNSLTDFADSEMGGKNMIKELIATLSLDDKNVPLDERLKKLDVYLKENVELANAWNYRNVLKDKKITRTMLLNLYRDVLERLEVDYRLVASTDKFENHFDAERAIPDALTEVMVYIPETKKYLSPFNYWMPYGLPSSSCINNNAFFYKKLKKGYDYEIRKVDEISVDDNVLSTFSEISVDDDLETVSVKKKSAYSGYNSYYFRNICKLIPADKISDFAKGVTFDEVNVDLTNITFTNKEYKQNYENQNPFIISSEAIIKDTWIENAGKNYMISLGKVLGKQTNLYQETERKNDVVLPYPKKYKHEIKFVIPNGYTVKKLDNLLFDKVIKDSEQNVIGKFKSKAEIEGNVVTISIDEFYNFTELSKEKYSEYRDVTNAAYDFYMSTLLLTKV